MAKNDKKASDRDEAQTGEVPSDAPAQPAPSDVTQSEAGALKLDAAALQNTVELQTTELNGLHRKFETLERELGELKTKYESAASRVVEVEQLLADAGKLEFIAGPESIFIGEDNNVVATTLSLDWGVDLQQAQAAITYAESLEHSHPDKARAIATSLANDVLPGIPNGDVSVRIRARQLLKTMDKAAEAERERVSKAQEAAQAAATGQGVVATG